MDELIGIPIESDRRAVAVLAALRRLEAEYAGRDAAPVPLAATAAAPHAPAAPPLCLAGAAIAAAALSASVAGAELLGWASSLVAAAGSGLALLLAAAACGLLLAAAGRRRGRRAPAAAPAGSAVTWLVAYTMHDNTATGARLLRTSVHQIRLPAEAEGRLKAILARADATAAR